MLDSKTYELLVKIYSKGQLPVDDICTVTGENAADRSNRHVACLLTRGFIEALEESCKVDGVPDSKLLGYKITLSGCAYVEQRRRDLRNFWIPYVITTLIALLSLVVAIMALRSPVCVCAP